MYKPPADIDDRVTGVRQLRPSGAALRRRRCGFDATGSASFGNRPHGPGTRRYATGFDRSGDSRRLPDGHGRSDGHRFVVVDV